MSDRRKKLVLDGYTPEFALYLKATPAHHKIDMIDRDIEPSVRRNMALGKWLEKQTVHGVTGEARKALAQDTERFRYLGDND